MSPRIQLSDDGYDRVLRLIDLTGLSQEDILDRAIDRFYRLTLLEATAAAYERLRQNPVEWEDELREFDLWDVTLADGLDTEPGTSRASGRSENGNPILDTMAGVSEEAWTKPCALQ